MSRHSNLPYHLYVRVRNDFLGPGMPMGTTPAIWHGIHCRPGQMPSAHVLLESGAHWSGLPLHSISTHDFDHDIHDLVPWGGMGDNIETWHAKYLEGLVVTTLRPIKGRGRHTGIVVDWSDGFSRYPQEHKPLSLVHLETGQFALLPNNYFLLQDGHFVEEAARENLKHYKRGDTTYWEDS
jgi:hypothetical protein